MSDHNYNQNFFIVPSYILNLPGLTLTFLKVYETIFQFWNKGRPCYLSNRIITERTGAGLTQIKEALSFFEKSGHLKRISKGTKRYLIQPEMSLELSGSKNEQVAAPPAGGSRNSGHEVAAPPATEIKNVNKENNNTPLSGSKPFLLTIKDLLTDNPHNIEDQMLNEWLMIRKKKKAPLTPTAWKRTNNVMTKLSEKGLSPGDCFERMVANGWQGMEYKYFEQELNNPSLVKSSSTLKKETDEERIKRWERERQENLRKRG